MKTLIELYDDMPIKNVLGAEMFQPQEMVLVCPPDVAKNAGMRKSLITYFKLRGCPVKVTFVSTSLLDAVKVENTLRQVLESREDCAIDISGGSDAALFAAGAISGQTPVFTYSWKKNTFFEIKNAPFARDLPCSIRLNAEACFLMAGGTLLPGREDNNALKDRLPQIDRLFSVFSAYRRVWNRQVSYFQKLAGAGEKSLQVSGARTGKADHGLVTADEPLLRELEADGLIEELRITDTDVSFRYPDETVRFWLRDMGSALELQVYRACLAAECFDDVILSAVVNWNPDDPKRSAVTNEIDVMAVRGIQPVFISCKTCEIKTEALNELAILRERFGGRISRAMIVTSAPPSKNHSNMRRRAAELGIEVVEWNDLQTDCLAARLRDR